MATPYFIDLTDADGQPMTGLVFGGLGVAPGIALIHPTEGQATPAAASFNFTEIGFGFYQVNYDALVNGEVFIVLDCGASFEGRYRNPGRSLTKDSAILEDNHAILESNLDTSISSRLAASTYAEGSGEAGSGPSAVDIREEIDANSTRLAALVEGQETLAGDIEGVPAATIAGVQTAILAGSGSAQVSSPVPVPCESGFLLTLKRGDTLPAVSLHLLNGSGQPVSLPAGTDVKFHMARGAGSATAKVNATATIVDGSSALVQYAWAEGDTDTPGLYSAEFQLTFPDESIETWPNQGNLTIRILSDVA